MKEYLAAGVGTSPVRSVEPMSIGVLVSLPSHVESLDPVVRRLDGARFVLAAGRWPSRHLDSRRWTRRALAVRGWTADENPSGDLDLLLCGNHVGLAAARAWLRPGGRIALWREESGAGRLLRLEAGADGSPRLQPRDPIALVCVPAEPWARAIGGCPVSITGDPGLDSFFEVGAAARARARLALDPGRPAALIVVESIDGAVSRWADHLGMFRSEFQLVLWAHDRCWLSAARPFPRALAGPGVRWVEPESSVPLPELLAAADVVLAEPGGTAARAGAVGRPVLLLRDDPARFRSRVRSMEDPTSEALRLTPVVEDPSHLYEWLEDVLGSAAVVSSIRPSRATERMLCALDGARRWLVGDLPARRSS